MSRVRVPSSTDATKEGGADAYFHVSRGGRDSAPHPGPFPQAECCFWRKTARAARTAWQKSRRHSARSWRPPPLCIAFFKPSMYVDGASLSTNARACFPCRSNGPANSPRSPYIILQNLERELDSVCVFGIVVSVCTPAVTPVAKVVSQAQLTRFSPVLPLLPRARGFACSCLASPDQGQVLRRGADDRLLS